MAEAHNIAPETREPINFDITDPTFINNYFDIVLRPYEDMGVDLWWIDWQQGTKTAVPGLDPLWALNHYHYLDNRINNKNPLILSRYAGFGSPRYPLGFSGDTRINWPTLKFQPYFTSTASNVGYYWWSHDIGGHHFGKTSDELYIRWVQLGTFSPINRLHSTSSDFLGKEPWRRNTETEKIVTEYLRLRHRIIPYLDSLNVLSADTGISPIKPIYWNNPTDKKCYKKTTAYYFGDKLLVCPITRKNNADTKKGYIKTYLPEGKWTDILTGQTYSGGQDVYLSRDITQIPLLANEGAIIPLCDPNDWENPEHLDILAYSGNGQFKISNSEDLGSIIELSIDNSNGLEFEIAPNENCSVKTLTVHFKDVAYTELPNFEVEDLGYLAVKIPCENTTIKIENPAPLKTEEIADKIINIFTSWQTSNPRKKRFYKKFKNVNDIETLKIRLKSSTLPKAVKQLLTELTY